MISFPQITANRWIFSKTVRRGTLATLLLVAGLRFFHTCAEASDDVISVYSSVAPGYNRPVVPGGGFKLETYAFGEGGNQGAAQNDPTIDKLGFNDIARIIAPTLAEKNYVPCSKSDPNRTDLLIMVYWGTTIGTDNTANSAEYQIAQSLIPPPLIPLSPPPTGGSGAMVSDPSASGRAGENAVDNAIKSAADSALQQSLIMSQMANRQRDRQDLENAVILGYLDEMKRVQDWNLTALSQRRQDVIDEVEESRYYVVLMAYDFPSLLQHKGKKLLWETRFSIRQRRNDFGKELAAMAESASRYFGQNSEGLQHKSLRDEHVNLGELKIIRIEPDKK